MDLDAAVRAQSWVRKDVSLFKLYKPHYLQYFHKHSMIKSPICKKNIKNRKSRGKKSKQVLLVKPAEEKLLMQ